jgi:HNH endonuclease
MATNTLPLPNTLRPALNSKFLWECFTPDFQNGTLIWNTRPLHHFADIRIQASTNTQHAGTPACSERNRRGYCRGSILGKGVSRHTILWWMYHGAPPAMFIDHIDHNNGNDSIDNLRDVSELSNNRNKSRDRRNKSGVTGVRWRPKSRLWEVVIGGNPKQIYLGSFKDFDQAVLVRKAAEIRLGYHPNHGT